MPSSGRDLPSRNGNGIDGLARSYAATRDPRIREELVRRHQCLVRSIAAEYRHSGHDDDLVQVGFLGLLNAIEHFDPARGTPFVAFARHFVRGEIRHYLRDSHNVMRRPRWMDRVNGQIEQAVGDHLAESGRYPGLAELAERLNLDEASLEEILKTREVVRTLSLDAEDEEGHPKVDLQRAPLEGRWLTLPLEDRMVLLEALEALNPLQRTVIFFIYFTDLTQAEAAQRIGISQKHVSRVLASALHRLRELLGPESPARPPRTPAGPPARPGSLKSASRTSG
ncbi:MAG: sigma-70 family RNA polymerase sigma factor [Armatimonadota bacterium]|nr:sigma-70 family RNA polymerase sigma factor [Armatimonadota bacterium]